MKTATTNIKIHLHDVFLKMSIMTLVVIILSYQCCSIAVPISSQQIRCMVVISTQDEQSIKIDINFPEFGAKNSEDQYYVVWVNNTQSEQLTFDRVKDGASYRREIGLVANVVYKVCFTIHTTQRNISMLNAEYQAYHLYRTSGSGVQPIKLPDSILKQNGLKRSYDNAQMLLTMTQKHINNTKIHKKYTEQRFRVIQKTQDALQMISAIEIIIIAVIGIVQFIVLKNKLENGVHM